MNICWVAGASAIANQLTIDSRSMWFMFPAMFLVVGTMLLLLRMGYTLTRKKALLIFGLYIIYIASFVIVF